MARFSLLFTLVLLTIASDARAQESRVFTQEITVYSEATSAYITIYSGDGNELHSQQLCDLSDPKAGCTAWSWIGDLDGDPDDPNSDSNCRDCNWGVDWDDASTDVLYFVFGAGAPPSSVLAYYAYSGTRARLQSTFWIPSNSSSLGSPDVNFYVDAQSNVTASTSGPSQNFESVFPGDYVMPYDADAFCAVHSTGGCNDFSKVEFFLARVNYAPGAIDPVTLNPFPADMREFTFASEGDARVYDVWSPTWDVPNLELFFPDGKDFIVEGNLDAEGVTLEAVDSNDGWGGLRIESGGAAELRDGSVVRDVKSFGGAAVTAFGDFTLDDSDIIGSTLGAGADGIYAAGAGTFVHVRNGSEVSGHEGDGIYTYKADVLVENSTIAGNSSDGVSAYKGDVFLYRSEVEDNADYGANAVFVGGVGFGWPAYSTPSQNNTLDDNAVGTLRATANSDLAAGTLSGPNGQNNFLRSGSELHAYARASSDVRAQCNYWGSASGPDLSFVDTDASSTYTYDPFLSAPGGTCGTSQSRTGVTSKDTYQGSSARGGPEAIPELVWEALQAADAGETEVAFGLLVSAVQTAATPEAKTRAYAAITRLARRGASPGLAGFLHGQSNRPSERSWALAALAEVHSAAGNVDAAHEAATALTAEYAGTDHALFGWAALFGLAVEAGDVAGAEVALAAAEAGWPEAEATAMLRREHTLRLGEGGGAVRGTVAGTSGGASGAGAEARGAATAAAEFALYPAYPNPSSGAVTVPLVLSEAAEVSVSMFDVLGREVAALADGRMEAGRRELTMKASALPAGLYVVRVTVRSDRGAMQVFTQRVSVVR